jgi:hypothetical protein
MRYGIVIVLTVGLILGAASWTVHSL